VIEEACLWEWSARLHNVHGCFLNSHLARRRHWQLRNEGIWNMEDTGKVKDSLHLLLLLLLLLLWGRRRKRENNERGRSESYYIF
jgi:hypothetical protein